MAFLKKINKIIKDQDLFGYQVHLHFGSYLEKHEKGN